MCICEISLFNCYNFYYRCRCNKVKCSNKTDIQEDKSESIRRTFNHAGKVKNEASTKFMERNQIVQKQSHWIPAETFILTEVSGFTRQTTRTAKAFLYYNTIQKNGYFGLRPKSSKQVFAKFKDLRDKENLYSPLRTIPVTHVVKKSQNNI